MMPPLTCRMVEFHRFAGDDVLRPNNKYIRVEGWDTTAKEVVPALNHNDLVDLLSDLRYGGGSAQDMSEARARLAAEADRFLENVTPAADELLQVDLVTSAGELWVFPFEAWYDLHRSWLDAAQTGVVLTRRIRGDFSENVRGWPVVPRVLFVHAPRADDLEQGLIDGHGQALRDALADWRSGKPAADADLLHVREVASAGDLAQACQELQPTSVHLLAHGEATHPGTGHRRRAVWGLRLGYKGEPGVAPTEVAHAIGADAGGPVVVTLAACDSANAQGGVFAVQSLAQELHRRGVPVVVGSQLPLTKPGSLVLVRAFYERLLCGEDVRAALHAARVALRGSADAHHDWLSLVGYVRLPPESYEEHLQEVGLRMELRMLDAAQRQADALALHGGTREEFETVAGRVRARLRSLQKRDTALAHRADLREERLGLEASACKRLAELDFQCGRHHESTRDEDWHRSRAALSDSLARYQSADDAKRQSHWPGVQQLALEAALTGRASRPEDWFFLRRTAELVRDRPPGNDYWSCGSLMELALLAPYAGQPRDLDAARAALTSLIARARAADDEFPISATRRQLQRYVDWWTNAHGYFPGQPDLSRDASALLTLIP